MIPVEVQRMVVKSIAGIADQYPDQDELKSVTIPVKRELLERLEQ